MSIDNSVYDTVRPLPSLQTADRLLLLYIILLKFNDSGNVRIVLATLAKDSSHVLKQLGYIRTTICVIRFTLPLN